jgi:hypothetical protein
MRSIVRKTTATCQRRNRQRRQRIAGDREGPVAAGAVAQVAEEQAQPVADQLAEAGGQADHRATRTEQRQVRAGDAAPTLIHHVGQQADHAHQHHKGHGAPLQAVCGIDRTR